MKKRKRKTKLKSLIDIWIVSTYLGLTSFGGPTAHLAYFYEEYVCRRKWLDEKSYTDLVALAQFLPGPASSQVGIGIGVMRAGILGGMVSFIGFTLPSVFVLIIFALLLTEFNLGNAGWIHGLKIVAVVIVFQAVLSMAKKLAPDLKRKTIALFALISTLLWQTAFTQVIVIVMAGCFGFLLYKKHEIDEEVSSRFLLSKRVAVICLSIFFSLLIILPLLRKITDSYWLAMFDSFYRAGSLVFGGGHVVLPLLEQAFVSTGWLSKESFLAGYGATQAVPGPLFTFAAYLGAIMKGWHGGLIATIAIFSPSFLLILGVLPFWDSLRNNPKIKGAIMGVNAAVVGILISALYDPIWTSSVVTPIDFALASTLFSLLVYWKLPTWMIVLIGAVSGSLIV